MDASKDTETIRMRKKKNKSISCAKEEMNGKVSLAPAVTESFVQDASKTGQKVGLRLPKPLHYGTKPGRLQTSDHTLFHEFESE